ncbi:ribosomal-processing cysteine protease Prp [Malacoplasma muris]|uniref:ribosomal-processing cysteine protease Prp n=1 Tax=Malacoplasma muris TaxID=2119 RepID=UPI00398E883B
MIKIDFYSNGFIVKDHANYNKCGNDIVCAGISAIIMGSLTWFDESDIIDCTVDEKVPIIKIVVKLNNKNETALSVIFNQINEVKKSYKNYINLNKYNKEL